MSITDLIAIIGRADGPEVTATMAWNHTLAAAIDALEADSDRVADSGFHPITGRCAELLRGMLVVPDDPIIEDPTVEE